MNQFIYGLVVGLVLASLGWFFFAGGDRAPATEAPADAAVTELAFVTHLEAGMPEQDVFVESETNATEVVRIDVADAADQDVLAQSVFTSSEAQEHDPFMVGESPLGPFEKGEELGFTMEEWLAASGSGTYTVRGDEATLDATFAELVPGGLYTVWCSRLTLPPDAAIVDRPCGAADGSENAFTADGSGNGTFQLTMPPLAPSTDTEVSAIALAYHSDDETHGAEPGDFGLNAHVQILVILPAPEEMSGS